MRAWAAGSRPLWLQAMFLAGAIGSAGAVVALSGAAVAGWALMVLSLSVAFGAAYTERRWQQSRREWEARERELEALRQKLVAQNEELRASGEALQAERRRLRDIVGSMGVGAAVVASDGSVTWANERMIGWFGQPTDLACAPLYSQLISPARLDSGSPVQRALLSGEVSQGDVTAETANGASREFHLICTPISSSGGKTDEVLMLAQDVTAGCRAQQEMRATLALLNNILQSTTHSAIIAADLDMSILAYNSGAESIFALARSQAVGRSLIQVHNHIGIDPSYLSTAMEQARSEGIGSYEVRLGEGDEGRFLECDVTLMRSQSGETTGYVLLARDVTNERRMAEDLRAAKEEAEKAYAELKEAEAQLLQSEKMASLGQLAAGVAHEINNPVGFVSSNISTLSGYIDALRGYVEKARALADAIRAGSDAAALAEELAAYEDEADLQYILEDVVDLLAETQDGLERVRKIVLDLKSFCRADDAERKLADINACLESTLNVVWNELKYKAEVIRDYGDIPEIECYPMQLNQVFMNMLVNAAQAIKEHGTITVSTRVEGDEVVVSISDTGEGIPEEIRSKIFDPFFTTKEVGKGTGLGLAMSYGIVEKHGGSIEVESEVGAGTTFTIRLPMAMPAAVGAEETGDGTA